MNIRGEGLGAAVLTAENLSKSFGPTIAVLEVNFRVSSGQIVTLIGSNGSGKSTLLKLIYGRLVPDSGCTRINGTILKKGDQHQARAKGIEMVFQEKDDESKLCPGISVLENLFLGREITSPLGFLRRRAMANYASGVFDHFGITLPSFDALVGELSGGQEKAVAIGRALLSRPSMILLDEPTASLGLSERRVIHQALSELRTAGVGIVLCSHSLQEVTEVGDRVVALRAGRVMSDQSVADLSEHDIALLMSK